MSDLTESQAAALRELFDAAADLPRVVIRAAIESFSSGRARLGQAADMVRFYDAICTVLAEAQEAAPARRRAFKDAADLVSPDSLGSEAEAYLRERDEPGGAS